MRWSKCFCLLSLGLACARGQAPQPHEPVVAAAAVPVETAETVDYRLSPVMVDGRVTALAVEIALRGDPSGLTRLELPDTWADARELYRHVRELRVDGATSVVEESPALRTIHAPAGAPLVVRYQVVSAWDHDPTADDGQPFTPIVRPDWFYLFGEALFAAPAGREHVPARFTWSGAPAGFGFASDLEHLAGARPGTVADVRESIVLGGSRMKLHARADGDGQIRVAIVGEYAFGDPALLRLAFDVVAAQREFWDDHGAPFLIVLAPLEPVEGSMSLGGTGRTDAFALTVGRNATIEPLRHLLGHEYFHTWNPRQLGEQQEGPAENTGKWFAEGFTEFYTWRLLLRAGLYTLEDFVAAWNETLLAYGTSPVRSEPNARIARDYWNVQAVSKLPYQRGPLLAAIWEQRLRAATAGARDLDDVLTTMRARVKAAGTNKLAPDAAGLFAPTYVGLGGPDLQDELERFVERGEPISLPADVFGECVRVHTGARRVFDRGWDSAATIAAGNVVTGLRKDSPAYRAGLREGMKIVAREGGAPGDSTVAYVLRVSDGKHERGVTFMRQGAAEVTVQQLTIVEGLAPARREACVRALAGL